MIFNELEPFGNTECCYLHTCPVYLSFKMEYKSSTFSKILTFMVILLWLTKHDGNFETWTTGINNNYLWDFTPYLVFRVVTSYPYGDCPSREHRWKDPAQVTGWRTCVLYCYRVTSEDPLYRCVTSVWISWGKTGVRVKFPASHHISDQFS